MNYGRVKGFRLLAVWAKHDCRNSIGHEKIPRSGAVARHQHRRARSRRDTVATRGVSTS